MDRVDAFLGMNCSRRAHTRADRRRRYGSRPLGVFLVLLSPMACPRLGAASAGSGSFLESAFVGEVAAKSLNGCVDNAIVSPLE